jgi:hypothetical protein
MLEIRARELFGGIYSFSVLPGMDGGGEGQRREEKESRNQKFATVIIAC